MVQLRTKVSMGAVFIPYTPYSTFTTSAELIGRCNCTCQLGEFVGSYVRHFYEPAILTTPVNQLRNAPWCMYRNFKVLRARDMYSTCLF